MSTAPYSCAPAQRLRVAVPAYSGEITADTAHSLLAGSKLLQDAGVAVDWDFVCGCCYIDHARNMLARRFMLSEATDLLFVDADVGFEPSAMLRIAAARRPFVAGAYPKKASPTAFPVRYMDRPEIWSEPDGLVEFEMVPTGFLRLNRAVLEAMDGEEYADNAGTLWRAWFRNGARDGVYWGEDPDFCRRWRALGGRIFMVPDITFTHSGPHAWRANWAEWMRGGPGSSPGQAPGSSPGQAPGSSPGQAPGSSPGQAPGSSPGQAPDQVRGTLLGDPNCR